jgi:uncharacterized protein YlxW (UPF0749 family)
LRHSTIDFVPGGDHQVKHPSYLSCCSLLLLGTLCLLTPDFVLAQEPSIESAPSDALANREQLLENETADTANEAAELAARRKQFEERIAE